MYFPILRGKQYELSALKELAKLRPSAFSKFTPVIEPVTEKLHTLQQTITSLNEVSVAPLVIINPQVGFYKKTIVNIEGNYVPTVVITSDNEISALKLIEELGKTNCVVIATASCPTETIKRLEGVKFLIWETQLQYAEKAQSDLNLSVVVLNDGFQKKDKNADYPKSSEFKSEIEATAKKKIYGFADYTITGYKYSDGGGRAYVVAIHLSELKKDSSGLGPTVKITMNHYKSTEDGSPDFTAKKFKEALKLLVSDVTSRFYDFDNTIGLEEYLSLHKRGHYPGLGTVKKLSISHHIETISNYLVKN